MDAYRLWAIGLMLVGLVMLPGDAAAQLGECDDCVGSPWGVMCLPNASNSGDGIDCYQTDPDKCEFRGDCNVTVAVNDLTVGGSIGGSAFGLVSSVAMAGEVRRTCDDAVAARYVTADEFQEGILRLHRITLE